MNITRMSQEANEIFFADPHVGKFIKGVVSFMNFFGTKSISNDIAKSCGNLFDTRLFKLLTLFCIFYQSTDHLGLSVFLVIIFSTFLYAMKQQSSNCSKESQYYKKHIYKSE
jgi:hypothetical protein